MLRLFSRSSGTDCAGLSRRDFLQAGTLGLGGLSLPWLLRQRAEAAEAGGFLRDRAVVLLFLSGGASHIETFNPNMDGPGPSRSATGEVATSVPGMNFGGTFPLLARHAHQMAVVKSFQHPIGGHVQAIVHVLTGGTDPLGEGKAGYSLGSAYARMRGTNHPATGMPTFALLNSEEVDPQYRSERGRVESGSQPRGLGAAFAPFLPGSKGTAAENMTLRIAADRLKDRRALLGELDQLKRYADGLVEYQGVDKYTEQAFDVILGSAAEAFDVSREPSGIRERYDTSHISIGKKSFRPSDLGRHMLTARRLVEAGCGFVTVHSAGWDMHADGNNPGIVSGMEMLGRSVDKAVSAFLEDLAQCGLSEKVLLVVTGDFGRTPKINSNGGRDHWPRLCTLAFAGGGLNVGQNVGQASRANDVPLSEPVTTNHLMSTVMHSLFDVGQLRLVRSAPRDLLSRIDEFPPIPGLIG